MLFKCVSASDMRNTYPTPILPTELCEYIIDYVADEDVGTVRFQLWEDDVRNTLRACALTCRAWTPRAQLHLFRFLGVVCAPGSRRSLDALVALLSRNSALQTYVESLSAYIGDDKTTTWRRLPAVLPRVLLGLRHLRLAEGHLYTPPGHAFELSLRRLTSVTRLVLYKLAFHSPVDLRRSVSAMHGLQSLVVSWPSWHAPCRFPPPPHFPRCRVRLHDVRIGAEAAWLRDPRAVYFVQWLARSGAVESLCELALQQMMVLDGGMLAAVESVLEASKNTLEVLALSLGPDIDFAYLSATLNRCPNLWFLSLRFPYHVPAISRLAAFLENLSIKPTHLDLSFERYPNKLCSHPTLTDWARVDTALRQSNWESLERMTVGLSTIEVDVRVPFVWGDRYATAPLHEGALCSRLRRWFPLAYKRRILWFDPGSSSPDFLQVQ